MTPLYITCANGHEEVARLLLDRNAAVDAAENTGATPLYVTSGDNFVTCHGVTSLQGRSNLVTCHGVTL